MNPSTYPHPGAQTIATPLPSVKGEGTGIESDDRSGSTRSCADFLALGNRGHPRFVTQAMTSLVASLLLFGLGDPGLIPNATGRFPVGTTRLPVELSAKSKTHRQIQLWYPASVRGRTRYVPDDGTMAALRAGEFMEQKPEMLDRWAKATIDAALDAPPAGARTKWPLVFLCPGMGMPTLCYTALAKQLASDGNLVVAIDFAPGGFLVHEGKLLQEGPTGDDEATYGKISDDWAAQMLEILDSVRKGAKGVLARADLKRVAAIGHSLGGAAALEAARLDPRIRACVNLDGIPESYVGAHGIASTVLLLRSHIGYSDADLERLHRTREAWDQKGKEILASMRKLLSGHGGDAWVLSVDGANHVSFSDAPFTMPTAISRWGGTPLEPERLQTIVVGLIEGYLANRFSGRAFPGKLPPEVSVQVRRVSSRTLLFLGHPAECLL